LLFLNDARTNRFSRSSHPSAVFNVKSGIIFDGSSESEYMKQRKNIARNPCKPKKNVLFLKTHKTGSSSVQNLLFRFGDKHNLTFVLPSKGNYFGHPQPFHRSMSWHSKNRLLQHTNNPLPSRNNIFAHHARFNCEEMKSIMPADTIFVTILRDPVSLIQSLVSYYDLKRFHRENSTDRFLQKFFSTTPNISTYHASLPRRALGRIGRNQMSFDLGLDIQNFDKLEMVRNFIRTIDSRFDLVMIVERMDESLVLLQRILCWTVDDMVLFRHNARNANALLNISVGLEQKIRHFNTADEYLYKYFSAKLSRRIAEFGETEMEKQVVSLRHVTDTTYHKCVEKQVPMKDIESSRRVWYNGLTLGLKQRQNTSKECGDLTNSELYYTGLLRQKQSMMHQSS
jgi:hypothetical protein